MLSYLKHSIKRHTYEMGGGGSSGGGGGGTSVTTQELPPELRPLATAYTTKATGLSNQPYTPYSGQRYEDLNATQSQGVQGIVNRASAPNTLQQSAETGLQGMMSNQENPYLRGMVDTAMGAAQGRINSQFGGSNYGSSANVSEMGTGLMAAANPLLSSAYESDQGRRMQAFGMAPQLQDAGYSGANQMLRAGQIMQDQSQQNKDFAYQQFVEERDKPYKDLAAMAGVFGTNLGGTSKTESTPQSSGGGGK